MSGATVGALLLGACPPPADAVDVAPGLTVRRRSSWDQGRGATGALQPEDVRFLLVHHTATNTEHRAADVPALLRAAYRYHIGPAKGWPDICYNFLVDRYGTVWEGRTGSLDGPVMVSATGGSQGFAQLVCLIGDFAQVLPTAAAQASLTRTLAWLSHREGIDTTPGATVQFASRGSNRWPAGSLVTAPTLAGHRTMSLTTCPGDRYFPVVANELPARVAAERAVMYG